MKYELSMWKLHEKFNDPIELNLEMDVIVHIFSLGTQQNYALRDL